MNIYIYNEIIERYIELKNIFYINDIDINIDKNIISLLKNDNIKKIAENIYIRLKANNKIIITILDKEYPRNLLNKYNNIPFCIICDRKINLNTKNIYFYFNEYFSKYGRKALTYFIKNFKSNNCNVFSKYVDDKNICLNVKYINLTDIENFDLKKENNIYVSKIYTNIFFKIIDFLIIIEAKYEEDIVKLVDIFLENNKDIYVVPSNIFSKNSYFSNYLIKQGADILLNKQDIKFITSKKIIY